jgi:thiol-disulfide isomerase/thioredoxin
MRSLLIYLIALPMLCASLSCSEQHPVIEGKVTGIGDVQVYLHAFDGKDLRLIDSVKSRKDVFVFSMKPERKHGMYHVRWGNGPADAVDVIYNYGDVKFSTLKDSLHLLAFDKSPENNLFIAFYPLRLTIRQLNDIGDQMNRADPVGNRQKLAELSHFLDSLEFSVQKSLDELDNYSKQLFSYKVLRAAFSPSYDYELAKGRIQKQDPYVYIRANFFNHIDFHEEGLTRTPFIHTAIEEYMNLYVSPHDDEQFRKACDMIISKAAVNDTMYEYVLNLLVKTFEISDFWQVYLYLMETYQTEICDDTQAYEDKSKLYHVVSASRPGSPANDISGFTERGEKMSLKQNAAGKAIVLLFWDPECEYCKIIIQHLTIVWPSYRTRGLSVMTFALTADRDEWLEAVSELQMQHFINITDLKDMNSEVFDKYHIRGTPEIYVLSEDFLIFSRPSNHMQLDKDLNQLMNN